MPTLRSFPHNEEFSNPLGEASTNDISSAVFPTKKKGEGSPQNPFPFPYQQKARWWFQTFLFSPRTLGRWSNLTIIFCRWVGPTTNYKGSEIFPKTATTEAESSAIFGCEIVKISFPWKVAIPEMKSKSAWKDVHPQKGNDPSSSPIHFSGANLLVSFQGVYPQKS